MSKKAQKRIRKHLREQLKGQARVEAKWLFPVLFMKFIWYMKPFSIDSKYTVKLPWIRIVKMRKGWFEITKFPPRQFCFRFRLIKEAVMGSKKITISK